MTSSRAPSMMSHGEKPAMVAALRRGRRAGRRIVLRVSTRASARHALVGQAHLWAMKRRFQFEFLTCRGLRPHHTLLDIGCGTLRGGIPLIEYLHTGHYVGIEARQAVLMEARRELAEAGLEHKRPRLIHAADPAQVRLASRVDSAWAFSVLIHMPDDTVSAYLRFVARVLTPGGELYANVILGTGRESTWQGFPVISRSREHYLRLAADESLIADELGPLADLGHRSGCSQDEQIMLRFTPACR